MEMKMELFSRMKMVSIVLGQKAKRNQKPEAQVRITDNGEGIAPSEVKKAFMRHATSKITKAEDLFGITSLGFRGEALSSIAAVCQVELITKTAGELTGVRYAIEGGEEKTPEPEEIGAPEGTTFKVRNVFYNTPVRRKFLKSPQTEAGYISSRQSSIFP